MSHGPWTTALGNTSAAPLSQFWRRRMKMLAVLTPVKRLPRQLQSALAVGAVALILMPIVSFTPSVVAVEKVLADQTEEANGGDGAPLRLDLPGGVVAELVAIGAPTAEKEDWWGPDGTLITAPCQRNPDSAPVDFPLEMSRDFVVRWVTDTPGITKSFAIVDPGTTTGSGEFGHDDSGKLIRSMPINQASFPFYRKTCTLRFSIAAGAWKTLAEDAGYGSGGKNPWISYAFSPAAERDGDVVMSAAHDIGAQDMRIVAIDNSGNEVAPDQTVTYKGRGFRQTTATFRKRRLSSIAEFRLQSRPFESMEVRGVPLRPGKQLLPQVVKVTAADR